MPHKEKPGQLLELPFAESKLENIDKAMLNYVDGELTLSENEKPEKIKEKIQYRVSLYRKKIKA